MDLEWSWMLGESHAFHESKAFRAYKLQLHGWNMVTTKVTKQVQIKK